MARQPRIGDEVQQLKGLLAGLSLETKRLRLDQYHRPQPTIACVYDDKTGLRGLGWSDSVRYATVSKLMFPETQQIIVIQMRESR